MTKLGNGCRTGDDVNLMNQRGEEMAEEKVLLLGGSLRHPELGDELTGIYSHRLRRAGYNVQVGATREQLEEALGEADLVIICVSINVATETLLELIPKEARRKTILWCVVWDLARVRRALCDTNFVHIGSRPSSLNYLLRFVSADLELVQNVAAMRLR